MSKNKKYTVREVVYRTYYDNLPSNLQELIDLLEEKRKGVPLEFQSSVVCYFESTNDFMGDKEIYFIVSYRRPETNQEKKARIEKDLKFYKDIADEEYKQYLKLQKKFDKKLDSNDKNATVT